MKKLRILIPSILVASTIPMVSIVGCDDKPQEKEYDLINASSEHCNIYTTKFKLNKELVIDYSIDEGWILNAQGSFITVHETVYTVAELPHTDTTITLSADKVNYETITVGLVAVEPTVIPLDTDGGKEHPEFSSKSFTIQIGTIYRFTIDTSISTSTKWNKYFYFSILNNKQMLSEATYGVVNFIVDNRTLTLDPNPSQPYTPDTYWFSSSSISERYVVAGYLAELLTNASHITIDLMFNTSDPTGDVCACFKNTRV